MKTNPNPNAETEVTQEIVAEIAAEATQESVPAQSGTEKKPLRVTPIGLDAPVLHPPKKNYSDY